MSSAMDELAALTADVHAWLSWQEMLGSSSLPRESLLKLPPVEFPAATSPRANPVAPPRSSPRTNPVPPQQSSPPKKNRVEERPAPVTPRPVESAVPKVARTDRPSLTDKWKVLMDGPTTHQVTGPSGAPLMIVRGSGSSPEAESMLNRMLDNVVGVSRAEVCVVDLIRDTRPPAEIGQGFRTALADLKPTVMLVMGTFAVRALFGDEHAVTDARGAWTDLSYEGGTVALRVTHHPEAILALAARGQSSPKREAFTDLKALGQRLT